MPDIDYSLLEQPEVANLRFSVLRDLLAPFDMTLTQGRTDYGMLVSVRGEPAIRLSALADDGDPYKASGLLFTKMLAWRVVPTVVADAIFGIEKETE